MLVIIVLIILCMVFVFGINNTIMNRNYVLSSNKIKKEIKIVHLSDLHATVYGENQEELFKKIHELEPDIIFMSGDMFDERRDCLITYSFLSVLAKEYECYFASGNYEYKTGIKECKELVEKAGVHYLENDSVYLKEWNITVCGVEDPYLDMNLYPASLNKTFLNVNKKSYVILLAHHPESIEIHAVYPCDLILCGHAHGGQWRIPKLINGIFAPQQGLFPKYAGGVYKKDNKTMIVNRGLALNTNIPRIYNRPEVIRIEIKKEF